MDNNPNRYPLIFLEEITKVRVFFAGMRTLYLPGKPGLYREDEAPAELRSFDKPPVFSYLPTRLSSQG